MLILRAARVLARDRPSGMTQEFRDVAADAIYEIVEGQGIKKTLTLSAPTD